MTDMKFGDLYLCDLAYSLEHPKNMTVPLVFMEMKEICCGRAVYCFCKIGNLPVGRSWCPYILIEEEGLRPSSAVYPTQAVSISNDSAILRKIGQISSSAVKDQILKAVQATKKEEKPIVMNLCPRCRKNFLEDSGLVVKRMDPFSIETDTCDFCQTRPGYTYMIYRRKY